MGLFKFLFGKKKEVDTSLKPTEESDGQEKYLIDKEHEQELPAPPAVKEKRVAPTVISGDKVKIAGSGGRTLKEAVRGGWVEKKSSNTVIRKVGGVVVNDEMLNAPAPKTEPIKKEDTKQEKAVAQNPATKSEKATAKKEAIKSDKATAKKTSAKPDNEPAKKPTAKQETAPKKADKKTTAPQVKKITKKTEKAPIQVANTEDGEVLESKATRSGKFELKKAKDGRFFFNLYASNHTVIAFSQIYSSSSSALNGIKSVMANAGAASIEDTTLKSPATVPFPKWEIYIDRAGQYRFRLYAGNGNCVCHAAHGYATKSGCKGGIDSITRFSAEARIDKKYLTK